MAARPYEFYFRVLIKNNIFEGTRRVNTVLFLTRENKFHIFKPPANFPFCYTDKKN